MYLQFQPEEEPLKGKFKLSTKPPEYSNFAISANGVIVVSVFACVAAMWVFMQLIIIRIWVCTLRTLVIWKWASSVHFGWLTKQDSLWNTRYSYCLLPGLTSTSALQLQFYIVDDHFDFRRAPQLPDTLQPRIFRCCQLAIPNARQAGWVKVMMSTLPMYTWINMLIENESSTESQGFSNSPLTVYVYPRIYIILICWKVLHMFHVKVIPTY